MPPSAYYKTESCSPLSALHQLKNLMHRGLAVCGGECEFCYFMCVCRGMPCGLCAAGCPACRKTEKIRETEKNQRMKICC